MGRPKENNGICKLCGNPAGITRNKDGTAYTRSVCHSCRGILYRNKLNRAFQCARCGWQGYCDKHHTDGNHANEANGNIEFLCPNCHRTLHSPLPDWMVKILNTP